MEGKIKSLQERIPCGKGGKERRIDDQWKRKAESLKITGNIFISNVFFFFFPFSEQEAGDPLILMVYSIPEASALLRRGKCFQRFQISWVMTPSHSKESFS